jgi:hypothetical protein
VTSARQQRPGGGPLIALKPAHQHNYRLSIYERKENDFYPTPSDLVFGLALGLSRLGIELPRVALDPCGGDGAIRRSLAPFGVDVRLSDLYPEMYPAADGYVTRQPLDASDIEHWRHAFALAGPSCAAVLTNTPHRTDEACAIVKNLIVLVEDNLWISSPRCSGRIAGSEGSPMHAYTWYVWRKAPRSGPR